MSELNNCPVCGAEQSSVNGVFIGYVCGGLLNTQSKLWLLNCGNQKIVEADKRIATLESQLAAAQQDAGVVSLAKDVIRLVDGTFVDDDAPWTLVCIKERCNKALAAAGLLPKKGEK